MRHGWAEQEDLIKLNQHQKLPHLNAAGVATSSQTRAGHHIILNAMELDCKEYAIRDRVDEHDRVTKRIYISKQMSGLTKGRVDEHESCMYVNSLYGDSRWRCSLGGCLGYRKRCLYVWPLALYSEVA